MSSLFSSQVKKEIIEFLNIILVLIFISILLSLISNYHWFFNLFDQFLNFYFYLSLFLTIIFLILNNFLKALMSFALSLFCAFTFYQIDGNVIASKENLGLRVYYQNINSSNSELQTLPLSIQKINSEIIAFAESTPKIEKSLSSLTNYTKKFSLSRDDNYGFLILGKTNFYVQEVYEEFGIPIYIKIYLEKYELKMYIVHLPPPLWKEAWQIQKNTLKKIATEINKDQSQSFMIVGDLNMVATSNQFKNFYKEFVSPPYLQKIISPGTWPSFMPAYLRLPIDHILSNKNFSLKVEDSFGSDHRGFVVQMEN